ncbi:MAG TPA: sulfatase-like hydrolase/transferase [Polyangiaceae bacterium]|nr:sulfatase-like hydrolase/transferase [Polyangiaceae bacterium]
MSNSRKFIDDVGRVLVAWLLGLAIEHVMVGLARRDELAGAWELWPARTAAAPVFLGCALFAALACVAFTRVLWSAAEGPKRALVAVVGAVVGWGLGTGRHFASPIAHVLLASSVACAAIAALYMYLSLRAKRPRALPWALLAVAALAWWADAHVLVRLYPVFHAALFAASLVASALAVLEPCLFGRRVARGAVIVAAACALYAPFAAKRLRNYDNLRRILVEAAPWMGRAVEVAAAVAPRDPSADDAVTSAPAEGKPALDWSGRDIVLVSIDALRADHVGAYGYARKTTPHIDALAKEGTLFARAYCPTPHTSYSITSMMTGKYVRPLLALGLGADSETLASDLRRYGYRTAAFYPPAVFFIDESKFQTFEERALDFEYRKVEFADPALRETQLRAYLQTAATDKPLFLWVHYFEPHEPYVQHASHHFGDADVDAYDSEIAEADDGVGRVVAAVREKRPNAIVIVTADHGEEFGDHGGRYHGTTVYEEQVRVPLLVTGPGVRAGARVDLPVQTIDLVPTILSALRIPRPARVRGRDLGGLLAGDAKKDDAGFAFAETDDYALLAKRSLRLVCEKRVDACALYDVATDAAEKHDVSASHAPDVTAMRNELAAVERSHGRFEGQGAALPDALRRGAAGDVTAAEEVAGLLDDVNVEYRREAARVLFDLRSDKGSTWPQMRRARDKDEDEIVRGTCAAALVRVDRTEDAAPATALLASSNEDLRRRAALALAERGDAAGAKELATWLAAPGVDFTRQRDIVAALATSKARAQVPALVALLGDVRLRGYVAEALGKLGDVSAKPALLAHFSAEPYAPVRAREAEALVALGAGREIGPALARYAGMPEPMPGALELAARAGLLDKGESLRAPSDGPLRLGVLLEKPGVALEIDGASVRAPEAVETWVDVPAHGPTVTVKATPREGAVRGFWVVAKSSELD